MTAFNGYWLMAAGLVALLALYGAACVQALRPRAGTLEWIARYDRPPAGLAGRWERLTGRDAPALAAACLIALAAWGFAAFRSVQAVYPAGGLPTEALLEIALFYGLFPLLTAAAFYLLVRGLHGSVMAALLASAALSLDLTADPAALLLASVQVLLLVRYLTAPSDASFAAVSLRLILAFAVSAVGVRLMPAMAALSAAMLVLLLCGAAGRFVELGRGWLIRSVLTAVLTFAVTTVLAWVPAAAAAGMEVPRLLISGAFYRFAALQIAAGLAGGFGWSPLHWLAAAYDWPVLLCGAAACIAGLAALLRRRDLRGLLSAVWFAALAVLWLLGGVYAMPLGCAWCMGGVWSLLCRRGRPGLAVLGACAVLALLLGQYAASWIFR